MLRVLCAIGTIWLAGCASEVMRGYVGKDITEVVLDYGAPSNVMKLPDGRVAFQWNRRTSYTTPVTTNIYDYGSYASATTYGGNTSTYDCLYTLFAVPNEQESFTVVDFREPSLMCE